MTAESPRLRTIMLVLSYDGTGYAGWQVQPRTRTVQECVESAVRKVTGESVRVLCAGRTDSGVHALGQVVSFRTHSRIPSEQFRPAVQSALPRERDIIVLTSREVHAEFHATYSAVRKTYRYLLFDGPILPPFLQRYVAYSRVSLDVPAMQEAASHLIGRHDFRCFETHYPNKATSIRTVECATIRRIANWSPWSDGTFCPQGAQSPSASDAPVVEFEFTADGFLYNMVRAIVGTLCEVGEGKRQPAFVCDVVNSLDRNSAGATAPPHGLYLVRVDYPPDLLTPPHRL